jgi:hypothetical protein
MRKRRDCSRLLFLVVGSKLEEILGIREEHAVFGIFL